MCPNLADSSRFQRLVPPAVEIYNGGPRNVGAQSGQESKPCGMPWRWAGRHYCLPTMESRSHQFVRAWGRGGSSVPDFLDDVLDFQDFCVVSPTISAWRKVSVPAVEGPG